MAKLHTHERSVWRRLWPFRKREADEISNVLPTTRCASLAEYRSFKSAAADRQAEISAFEKDLLGEETFYVPGYCLVCQRESSFLVDYLYASIGPDGLRTPNWRERLVCPHCGLNNRMRAAAGFVLSLTGSNDTVYLTESVTPFFKIIASQRERTIGSEYLRDGSPRGATNVAGVRHEDATCLTFDDGSLDMIGSFDVLEHVPDYRRSLTEFFRCLRPNGTVVITVPFIVDSASTVVRATVDDGGNITHVLPPEFHGDPVNQSGALCFYHFGWDFVSTLADAGFEDAGLSLFWSPRFGHLGGHQFVITARKPSISNGLVRE